MVASSIFHASSNVLFATTLWHIMAQIFGLALAQHPSSCRHALNLCFHVGRFCVAGPKKLDPSGVAQVFAQKPYIYTTGKINPSHMPFMQSLD